MVLDRPVRGPTLSVVVRLWRDEGAGDVPRGEVERVGTGEKHPFRTYGALIAWMELWWRGLSTANTGDEPDLDGGN
jgi:hypothetical protein